MAEVGVEPWVVVLCVVVLVVGVATFRPFVRTLSDGRHSTYERPPSWWAWGDAIWHAHMRTVAFAGGGGFAFIFTGLVLVAFPTGFTETTAFKVVLGVVLLGYPAIWVMIALFNRPRIFVPAPMRDKPGLIREVIDWLRERKRHNPEGGTRDGT